METFLMFLATSLVLRIPSPRFQRYLLGQSRCTALLPSGHNRLHIKYTKEGDKVYFNDATIENVTYGLICVNMENLYTIRQAETILIQYITGMRKPLHIAHNTGMQLSYERGQITIADYWQDVEGKDWMVRGYSDGKTVAVLYVKNVTEIAVHEHDVFLNGFRFSSN
ncbi:MAG: hypothetical protein M3Y85_04125 [Bacteroidota bacterium]|nr:hypothetical protein [Bacteroidota bacterium]